MTTTIQFNEVQSQIDERRIDKELQIEGRRDLLNRLRSRLEEIKKEGELERILATAKVPGEFYYSRRLVSQEDRLKAGAILKEVAQIAFDAACSKERWLSNQAYRMYMRYCTYAEYDGKEKDVARWRLLEKQRLAMLTGVGGK